MENFSVEDINEFDEKKSLCQAIKQLEYMNISRNHTTSDEIKLITLKEVGGEPVLPGDGKAVLSIEIDGGQEIYRGAYMFFDFDESNMVTVQVNNNYSSKPHNNNLCIYLNDEESIKSISFIYDNGSDIGYVIKPNTYILLYK
jgi:hypothetical protein